MPKRAKELDPLTVSRLSKPGFYAVGKVPGLHLRVKLPAPGGDPSPCRSWVMRIMVAGRRRDFGLGTFSARETTLALAVKAAQDIPDQAKAGVDPSVAKRRKKEDERLKSLARMTFRVAAEKLIAQKTPEWKNAKHAQQWTDTLANIAGPFIGDMDVGDIDTLHVLSVLEQPTDPKKGDMRPIWETKTETAKRLRARIEAVIAWDDFRVNRIRLNPARWSKHLEMRLAKPNKIAKVTHHRALPLLEVPAFMTRLRAQEGIGARALEFAILTATRSGEVRNALWSEIDFDKATWIIPAERMKAGNEHRVPLSKAAVKLLKAQVRFKDSDHVFPSPRDGKAVSDMTLSKVTRSMAVDAVPHGFRSSFRDWAAELTNYPSHAAEMALAHTIGNKVEAAYRRGALFEKRVAMMEDWSKWLSTVATVKPTAKAAAKRAPNPVAKAVAKKAAVKSKGRETV